MSYVPFEPDYSAEPCQKPNVGDNISGYWPLMNSSYNGRVHQISGDKYVVHYDEGGVGTLILDNENWKYCAVIFPRSSEWKSTHLHDLKTFLDYFGNRPFMKFEERTFSQYLFQIAYKNEENSFKKIVMEIPIQDVPDDANKINSHVLYKVNVNNDMSVKLKARIACHGNKELLKDTLRTDVSMCPPVELRIIISVAALYC